MKTLSSLLLVAAVSSSTSLVSAKIERVVEKTFTVQPGGHLSVATQGGNIRVVTADNSNEVHVVATESIKASTDAEADKLLESLTLDINQKGNDVSAEARFKDKRSWGWKNGNPVTVNFVVTVPVQFNAELKTSGGNLDIGNLKGEINARTSGGNVNVGKIVGTVDASTSGGNVSLEGSSGNAKLSTSGGDIRVHEGNAALDLSTSGGNIIVESAQGPLKASTSGGDVRVTFSAPLSSDVSLGTSGGNVKVTVPTSAAFHLDASTSGGGVTANGIQVAVERGGPGKSRLEGNVNGGGHELKLRTSGGDVVVSAR